MLRYIDSAPPVLTSVRLGGLFLCHIESPQGLLPFYGRSLGGDFCVKWLQSAELSLYSLCTVRARLGRCCVILIFSPSGSHFGETGGAFFALYGIAPGASAVLRQEPGGRFVRSMASVSAELSL